MGGWMLSALTAEALIRDRGRRIANAERAGEGGAIFGAGAFVVSTPQRSCNAVNWPGNGTARLGYLSKLWRNRCGARPQGVRDNTRMR